MFPSHMSTSITFRNSQLAASRLSLRSCTRIKGTHLIRRLASLSSKSILGLLCTHQDHLVEMWCRRDPEAVWTSFKPAPQKQILFLLKNLILSHLRCFLSGRCQLKISQIRKKSFNKGHPRCSTWLTKITRQFLETAWPTNQPLLLTTPINSKMATMTTV